MSPAVIASMITSASTLGAVLLANQLQARRIDRDNKGRLDEQTSEIKQHLKEGGAP